MTVDANSIDLAAVMSEHLETAEPDLLRELLRTFVQALMSADADAACGAEYGTNSGERSNTRNGYRSRGWDTRTGSIERGQQISQPALPQEDPVVARSACRSVSGEVGRRRTAARTSWESSSSARLSLAALHRRRVGASLRPVSPRFLRPRPAARRR